jgi:hypothetical protein
MYTTHTLPTVDAVGALVGALVESEGVVSPPVEVPVEAQSLYALPYVYRDVSQQLPVMPSIQSGPVMNHGVLSSNAFR